MIFFFKFDFMFRTGKTYRTINILFLLVYFIFFSIGTFHTHQFETFPSKSDEVNFSVERISGFDHNGFCFIHNLMSSLSSNQNDLFADITIFPDNREIEINNDFRFNLADHFKISSLRAPPFYS